jgi:hypothetical protein
MLGAATARPMWPPSVVVRGVHGKHLVQVALAEDQTAAVTAARRAQARSRADQQ